MSRFPELEEVDSGSSGHVYRVFVSDENRWAALKIIDRDLQDASASRRYAREFQTMARLSSHPNIVTLFDAGVTEIGQPYILMEYCPNGSFGDALRRGHRFTIDEVLDVGIRISGALATAHREGIRHRDIKPENILMSEHGPVLCDFGIAGHGERASEHSQGLFTPSHMPPESPDHVFASDVYSLGSTLYTLIAGVPPFQAQRDGDLLDLLNQIRSAPPAPLPPDIPDDLRTVLLGTLEKDPNARRPATALELGQALQQVQRRMGSKLTRLPVPQRQWDHDGRVEPTETEADTGSVASLKNLDPSQSLHSMTASLHADSDSILIQIPDEPSDDERAAVGPPEQDADRHKISSDLLPPQRPVHPVLIGAIPRPMSPVDRTTQLHEEPTPENGRDPWKVALRMAIILIVAIGGGIGLNLLRSETPVKPALNSSARRGLDELGFAPPTPQNPSGTTPLVVRPSAPTDLRSEWSLPGEATLSWTDNASAESGFIVKLAYFPVDKMTGLTRGEPTSTAFVGRSLVPSPSLEDLGTIPANTTELVLQGINPGAFTCVVVVAVNVEGVAASAQYCLPGQAPAPLAWEHETLPDGRLSFTWDELPADAELARLYKGTSPAPGSPITVETFKSFDRTERTYIWPEPLAPGLLTCFAMSSENAASMETDDPKGKALSLPPGSTDPWCVNPQDPSTQEPGP